MDTLFDKYYPVAKDTAEKFQLDEDQTQDLYLFLLERCGSGNFWSNPEHVLRTKAASMIAAGKGSDVLSLDTDCGNFATTSEDRILWRVCSHDIAEALRTLPKNEALVLTLYYYAKMTHPQIAEILGKSSERVHRIHDNAIRHMQNSKRNWRLKNYL